MVSHPRAIHVVAMNEDIKAAVAVLREKVAGLDVRRMSSADAAELIDLFCQGERACQAGRSLASTVITKTRAYRAMGYRSPAQFLADKTQSTLSSAITTLSTAQRLQGLADTRDAFIAGRISEVQAAVISEAAQANPRAEQHLLDKAGRETVRGSRRSAFGPPRRSKTTRWPTRPCTTPDTFGTGASPTGASALMPGWPRTRGPS
jgi:hypothetical protein